jgi:hypothetical protein
MFLTVVADIPRMALRPGEEFVSGSREMKKLIVITAIVLLPATVFAAFSLQFDNTTGKKMVYMLYWIDHTFDWPYPFNLAGGELEASKTANFKESLPSGKYYVLWSDKGQWQNKVVMNVSDDVKTVVVTPIKSRMKK